MAEESRYNVKVCIMKRAVVIFLAITFLLICSCTKGTDIPAPLPERDLSTPEKVEKEIMEVLSKDWNSLSDTIAYFNSSMLSKGQFAGNAPDGVFYGLRTSFYNLSSVTLEFQVADSVWAAVNGRITPLEISLNAFDTEITIEKESQDSTSLRFSKIKAIGHDLFFFEDGHQAILLYEGRQVGFITREEMENTDYSTGKYLVAHYYDDPRTFAYYDKGLADLLKLKLADVLK